MARDKPYMVFAGKKFKTLLGESGINWNHDQAILGVFFAPTADLACQAASVKAGFAGTFFAVEGVAWGVDMQDIQVKEYGVKGGGDRLDRIEAMLEQSATQLRALPSGSSDDDKLDQIEHQIDEIERLANDPPDEAA